MPVRELNLSITIENNNAIPNADTPSESDVVDDPNFTDVKRTKVEKKKSKLGLSSLIANIFGPKKKIIPGVSPKIRLRSPKIKIASPKKNHGSSVETAKGNLDSLAQGEDEVTAIENDPGAWSSEVICGDYADMNLATGPLPPSGNDPTEISDYQNLLDSMRLTLDEVCNDSNRPHRGPNKATNRKDQMDTIVEDVESGINKSGRNPGSAIDEVSGSEFGDDSTFEESSVSLSEDDTDEGDGLDGNNSDWTVDNGSDNGEEKQAEKQHSSKAQVSNSGKPKPLSYYVEKSKPRKASNISEISPDVKLNPNRATMKNTLYGVPITLSSSMKKELADFASYGPSVRIETLRIVLEDRLGEKPFLRAYHYLKSLKNHTPSENEIEEEAEEEKLLEDMEQILGTENLRYLDLLYELITAEENF